MSSASLPARADQLAAWKENGRPNGTQARVASKTMKMPTLRVGAVAEAQRAAARAQREDTARARALQDHEAERALRQAAAARALRDEYSRDETTHVEEAERKQKALAIAWRRRQDAARALEQEKATIAWREEEAARTLRLAAEATRAQRHAVASRATQEEDAARALRRASEIERWERRLEEQFMHAQRQEEAVRVRQQEEFARAQQEHAAADRLRQAAEAERARRRRAAERRLRVILQPWGAGLPGGHAEVEEQLARVQEQIVRAQEQRIALQQERLEQELLHGLQELLENLRGIRNQPVAQRLALQQDLPIELLEGLVRQMEGRHPMLRPVGVAIRRELNAILAQAEAVHEPLSVPDRRAVSWSLVVLDAAARSEEPCPICYEPHARPEVVQTICMHAFCVPCWEAYRASQERGGFALRCPMCHGLRE
ncbi:hypothetical protein OAO87_01330 [bacterium]|nr:hypothetical protein [bacterium]